MFDLEDKILATLSKAGEIMDLLAVDNLYNFLADSKATEGKINCSTKCNLKKNLH